MRFLFVLLVALHFTVSLQAQWTGLGAGGSATDVSNSANYANGTSDLGSLSSIVSGTYALDASTGFTTGTNGLDLGFTANSPGTSVTIGDGTGSAVITLGGDLQFTCYGASSAVAPSVCTFGSDIGIDLGGASRVIGTMVPGSTTTVLTPPKVTFNGPITGSGGANPSLTITDAGLYVFNGNMTVSGGLLVQTGTVVLTGLASNAVTISRGAALCGTGTIAGTVSQSGGSSGWASIQPGASAGAVGTLTVNGAVTLNSYCDLVLALNNGAGGTAGTDYSQVRVGGNTNFGGATLDLRPSASFEANATIGATFTVLTLTSGGLSGTVANSNVITSATTKLVTAPSVSGSSVYTFKVTTTSTALTLTLIGIGQDLLNPQIDTAYASSITAYTAGGFEGAFTASGNDSFAPGWSRFPIDGVNAGTITQSTSVVHSGTSSQVLTTTKSMNGHLELAIPIPGGIVAGNNYQATAWVKSAKRYGSISLNVHNSNWWFPSTYAWIDRIVGQQWTQIALRFNAATTDANAYLVVSQFEENSVWVDDVTFKTLVDSDRAAAPSAGNLIRNGSFETGLSGWVGGSVNAAITTGTGLPHGGKCLNFSWYGNTGNRLQSLGLSLPWGYTYTLSFYAKCGTTGQSMPVAIASANNTLLSSTFALTTSWARYSFTFVLPPVPDETVYLSFDPPNTSNVYLDAVQLEAGASATAFAPRATVESQLDIDASNGIYTPGGTVSGTLTLYNNAGTLQNVALRRRVRDLWGNARASDVTWTQPVPASGGTTATFTLPVGIQTGAFRIECDVASDTTPPYAEALYTVAPTVPASTPYGTTLDYNVPSASVYHQGGAGWTKTWAAVDWGTVQTGSAASFSYPWDSSMNTWSAAGLNVLGVLSNAPSWARAFPVGWGWSNPADFNQMTTYATNVVAHYNSQVPVWELENEPNQSEQYADRAGAYAVEAVALMNGALAANPNAKLLLGSITIRDDPAQWLQAVLTAQPALMSINPSTGRPKIYGVSYHFYTADPGIVHRIASTLSGTLATNGLSSLKIWDTEWTPCLNYQSMKRDEIRGVTQWGPSAFRGAAMILQGHVARLGEGEDGSVLYDTYNPGDMANADHKMWMELDRHYRPTFAVQAVLANLIPNPTSPEILTVTNTNGVAGWAYRFTRADNAKVTVLWASDLGSGPISYTLPQDAVVYDMMGNLKGGFSAGQSVSTDIDPIYIVGTSLTAPTNFTLSIAANGQVNLSWTDNASGESGYIIERSTDQSNWTSVTTTGANATSYTDTVSANVTTVFYYRIRATGPAGASPYVVGAVTVTPALSLSPNLAPWYILSGTTGVAPLSISNLLAVSQTVSLVLSATATSGYTAHTSDDVGGPAYSWTDISTTGTALSWSSSKKNDGLSSSLSLGFNFPFYGTNYSTVRVCTNGWISFTESSSTYALNTALPNATTGGASGGAPRAAILPFWYDLNADSSSSIRYKATSASEYVISYNNIRSNVGTNRYTFQVVLRSSGEILLRYQTMASGTTYTVGIQNSTGTQALSLAYNPVSFVKNSFAVRILPASTWASLAQSSVVLAAGETKTVNLNFNTAYLWAGTEYDTTLSLTPLGGATQSYPVQLMVATGLPAPPVIAGPFSQTVNAGAAFNYQISASNSPNSYSAAGLPGGLSLNTATGVISGTVASPGVSNVTLGAINTGGTGTATLNLTALSPLQAWRMQYWGVSSNTGSASDTADPNNDGVPNLIAYALGLGPMDATVGSLPKAGISGGCLTLTFRRMKACTDITYHVLSGFDPGSMSEIWISATVPYSGGDRRKPGRRCL